MSGTTQKGNLVVLGNKPGAGKGGLKALGVAAAPTPLNTPSLKRENNGRDVNAVLVPVGSGVWGNKSGGEEKLGHEDEVSSQQQLAQENMPVSAPVTAPKAAPWALQQKSDSKPPSAPRDDPYKERKSSRLRSWMDEDSDEDSGPEDEEEVNLITIHIPPFDENIFYTNSI